MPISQLPIPFLTEWASMGGSKSDVCTPTCHEVDSITELFNIEEVKARLHAISWDFTNEDTSYLTHDVHPYPAKFIPQIPAHLIANLSLRGDLVLDPFCGSGTTGGTTTATEGSCGALAGSATGDGATVAATETTSARGGSGAGTVSGGIFPSYSRARSRTDRA